MLRLYYVSVHFFRNAAQTSKHKERAVTMIVEALNNFAATEAAKIWVVKIGAKRITKVEASLI